MTKENSIEIWNKAKELLKQETTEISFVTWIQPLELKNFNDNIIILSASNTYQRDYIEAQYLDLITNTFNFITHKKCQVFIKLETEDTNFLMNKNTSSNNKVFMYSGVNPKYTFSNFVVGNNNKFAHAAAMGVA